MSVIRADRMFCRPCSFLSDLADAEPRGPASWYFTSDRILDSCMASAHSGRTDSKYDHIGLYNEAIEVVTSG